MNDFIGRYIALLYAITDAPEEFQEAAALFLISAAAGLKWVFRSIPETPIFTNKHQNRGKTLNLWIIIMGITRITRKSTGVISHVEDILKDIFGEQPFLSKDFTPEYLVKELANKTLGFETYCIWIRDEISGFFEQLRRRDSYMTTADAVLSTIYDGFDYIKGTITRGKESILRPYLTCFLASTEFLPTLFQKLQIRLGFLNRFIFVIGKRKARKPLRVRSLTESERSEAEHLKEFLKALINKRHTTVMTMSEDAKQRYDVFEMQIENRLETENLGIKEGYWGNLPNFTIRLSCLYRLSRMTVEEIRNHREDTLSVDLQDVERAIEYVWKVWGWFEEVIEVMLSGKSTETRRLRDKSKEFIVSMLKDEDLVEGSNIVEVTSNETGASDPTIYNALRELRDERVVCSPKYKFYKLKEDCKNCESHSICGSSNKDSIE